MWNELYLKYAQRKIYLCLSGTGATRITDNKGISNQEALESMLLSLKLSKAKFVSPSSINIVLKKEIANTINFEALRIYDEEE